MGRFAEKIPKKRDICPRYRSGNVCSGITKAYWEDLCGRWRGEEGGTDWKEALAVCCGALREDNDSLMWMLID